MRIAARGLALVMIACGGGTGGGGSSGIPPETPFVELTSDELRDLCEHLVAIAAPGRVVSCPTGGDQVVEELTLSSCLTSVIDDQEAIADLEDCDITAGQYEACLEDIVVRSDAEVCNDESIPASCRPLFECA